MSRIYIRLRKNENSIWYFSACAVFVICSRKQIVLDVVMYIFEVEYIVLLQ